MDTLYFTRLKTRLRDIEYLNYLMGAGFLLVILSPSLVHMLGAPSMALGQAIVILFYFIAVLNLYSFDTISEKLQSFFKVLIVVLLSVLVHGLFNYFARIESVQQLNITRFFYSFGYLIFFVLGAFSFVMIVRKVSIRKFNFIIYFVFISYILIALLSFMGFSPFQVGGKPMLFYSEPSHYAIDFLPFLLYIVIQAKPKNKIICLLIAFEIALLVQNLTLMVGVIFVSIIALRAWILIATLGSYIILYFLDPFFHSLFSIINSSSAFVISHEDTYSYLADRLTISNSVSNSVSNSILESVNGSFLVYASGWERAYLNCLDNFCLGIGFQQLGFVGSVGLAMERVIEIYKYPLGLYDGGTVASKFFNEFGVVALLFMGVYVTSFYRVMKTLRTISFSNLYVKDLRKTFFMCCFVIYAVDLFVRGFGYFSFSGFLFVSSLLWKYSSNKKVN
jgi:hypothetical protein